MDKPTRNLQPSFATQVAVKAVFAGSLDILKFALENDADITHTTEAGHHLLLIAAGKDKKDIVEYLLSLSHFQNAAIINQKNDFEESTLECLCHCNDNKKIIETLLQIKDVNVNIQDADGNTPLHQTIGNNTSDHVDVANLLLEHGANPIIKNRDLATPAMYPCADDLYKKLTQERDSDGNSHVHFLAMTTAHNIKGNREITVDQLFTNLLSSCLRNIPHDIWATNNDGKLPIEVAYETYRRHRIEYDMSNNKTPDLFNILIKQEQQLHTFARFYALHIKNKPLTITSSCADQLNVETAVAEKYKDGKDYDTYYTHPIPYRDKLKQDLFNKLHSVPKLYVSKEEYRAPKILSIQNN